MKDEDAFLLVYYNREFFYCIAVKRIIYVKLNQKKCKTRSEKEKFRKEVEDVKSTKKEIRKKKLDKTADLLSKCLLLQSFIS